MSRKGTRKLPQELTNAQTMMVASPGRATGSTTSRRIWPVDAPKTRADSSYDFGTASTKSFRMKIAAGNNPPVITNATPKRESISPSWNIITKIGTMAAVPVTTDDSTSNPYSSAPRPGIRPRDSAYDASAAKAVTATAVVTQISSELTIECIAYG